LLHFFATATATVWTSELFSFSLSPFDCSSFQEQTCILRIKNKLLLYFKKNFCSHEAFLFVLPGVFTVSRLRSLPRVG